MKRTVRAIVGMGVLIMAVLALFSCSAPPEEENSASVLIPAESLAQYWIVRPESATGTEVSCGSAVHEALKKKGLVLELTTDFYREGVESKYYSIRDYEILIGDTNRQESEKFLYQLQPWQYGYACVDGKIVIAGHSDETLQLAVDAFISMISSKNTLEYLETDDYIYGDIAEGTGRVYSVLNLTIADEAGAASAAESIASKTPDVVTAQCAVREAADSLIALAGEAYAVGADFESVGGGYHVILYRSDVYSFSSAELCPMAYLSYVAEDERGAFAYCVLRCTENKEKFVFCSTDISALDEVDQASRMKVLADFAANSERLPIVISGLFSGQDAIDTLLDAGQTDFARLAGVQTDGCLYGSYKRIVPSVVEQPGDGQLYCEFQQVQK